MASKTVIRPIGKNSQGLNTEKFLGLHLNSYLKFTTRLLDKTKTYLPVFCHTHYCWMTVKFQDYIKKSKVPFNVYYKHTELI